MVQFVASRDSQLQSRREAIKIKYTHLYGRYGIIFFIPYIGCQCRQEGRQCRHGRSSKCRQVPSVWSSKGLHVPSLGSSKGLHVSSLGPSQCRQVVTWFDARSSLGH